MALPAVANEHLDKTHSVELVYAILENTKFTSWQRVIKFAFILNSVEFKTGTLVFSLAFSAKVQVVSKMNLRDGDLSNLLGPSSEMINCNSS